MIFGSDPFGTTPFASWDEDSGYKPGTVTVTFSGYAPLVSGVSPVKASQIWRESMYSANASAKISSLSRETMYSANASAKVSQLWREVMRSIATQSGDDNGFVSIIW